MNFQDYINKGMAFFNEGKYDQVIENLELALKLQPDNADLQQLIEMAKMQIDNTLNASQLCIEEAKSKAEILSAFGVELNDVTIPNVSKIIEQYRNSDHDSKKEILLSAYYIRGLLYDSKKKYVQSAENYSEAIKIEPRAAVIFNKRGHANREIGNYEQAIEDFKKANLDKAELNQRIADIYMKWGQKYDMSGNPSDAAKKYSMVLKFDPDNSSARELLAMAKAEMKK